MAPRPTHFPARAKNVIYLFMAGGPSQLDLFDYKSRLAALNGHGWVASGGADGFVCLWDAGAGTLLRRCGVEGPVAALASPRQLHGPHHEAHRQLQQLREQPLPHQRAATRPTQPHHRHARLPGPTGQRHNPISHPIILHKQHPTTHTTLAATAF
jgi:hypothetical protein